MVDKFMNNPIKKHLKVVHKILQNLKKNPGKGLYFKKTSKINME